MKKAREAPDLRNGLTYGAFIVLVSFQLILQGCSQPIAGTSFLQRAERYQSPDTTLPTRTVPSTPKYRFAGAIAQYGPLVREYADQFEMDWTLVLAVMKQESKFDHEAVSHKGAYGLMQIMPMTQAELTERLGISETQSPKNNIKAGVYHLRWLYDAFPESDHADRIRLTLAAYNGGIGRVRDAQRIAAYLGNDPNRWPDVRDALPLMTRNKYTLHENVWEAGRPPSGYFRNWRETKNYVDAVMGHFEEYTVALR